MRQNRQLNQLANRFLVNPESSASSTTTNNPDSNGLGELYEAWGIIT